MGRAVSPNPLASHSVPSSDHIQALHRAPSILSDVLSLVASDREDASWDARVNASLSLQCSFDNVGHPGMAVDGSGHGLYATVVAARERMRSRLPHWHISALYVR
jgi:hypothetical protein